MLQGQAEPERPLFDQFFTGSTFPAEDYDFAETSSQSSTHSARLPTTSLFSTSSEHQPTVFEAFTQHSQAQRVNTESVVASSLRQKYPDLTLTITNSNPCDLLGFARAGHASAIPHGDADEMLFRRSFLPPARRLGEGRFAESIEFACFKYSFEDVEFLVYLVNGRDGVMAYPELLNNYILNAKKDSEVKALDRLIEKCSRWAVELHDEILVFDSGMWLKDAALWKAIRKSHWADVILEEDKKKAVIDDVNSFFSGQKQYEEYGVPWKRGLIFYGPPGNGKTISIKALMNDLTTHKDPAIELLYVKTLTSPRGPEGSIRAIFTRARAMAPCLLIFEDLDSLISDNVRSYFLNEVDGLEANDGILMIGSTNHLDRLDPGISKRPSRFDRKYFFDLPSHDERVQYCEYWRNKLKNNEKIDFPRELSELVAGITHWFSFAYLKEVFVASLLVLARQPPGDDITNLGAKYSDTNEWDHTQRNGDGERRAKQSALWKEIQKQVKYLRDELEHDNPDTKRTVVLGMPHTPFWNPMPGIRPL